MRRTCNAGYQRSSSGSACVACAAGTDFRVAQTDLRESVTQQKCQACTACVAGATYESGACTATRDRVCTACTGQCGPGQRISSVCTVTQNTQCAACATACAAGKYLSGDKCTGTTQTDVVLDSCRACLSESECEAGKTYLNFACSGSGLSKNACSGCSSRVCPAGQYSGGCGGLKDTQCLPYTACGAGFFLSGWGETTNGVCVRCRDCAGQGLVTKAACSAYFDAVCGGQVCGPGQPCSAGGFCDYVSLPSSPSCGACPVGYGSDGYVCVECPEGKTCDRNGTVACNGQCDALVRSECDAALGYAMCEEGLSSCGNNASVSSLLPPEVVVVWRGTYRTPQAGDCVTYFRCAVGYSRRFTPGGGVGCVPCTGKPALTTRYVSGGLTDNDAGSCLWECDYGKQQTVAWNGTACVQGPRLATTPWHAAGWYGAAGGGGGVATCGRERTSEANTTLTQQAGCLACPPLPAMGQRALDTVECGWTCASGWVQRGARCVAVWQDGWLCDDEGVTLDAAGQCVASSVPWNRAGTRKAGVMLVEQASLGAAVAWINETRSAVGVFGTLEPGKGPQAWLRVPSSSDGGNNNNNDHSSTATTRIAGLLCSAAMLQMPEGGGEGLFVVGTVCNSSFLVYFNVTDYNLNASKRVAPAGLQVLIGQPGSPGWADGFRTQARFRTELHVAVSASSNSTNSILGAPAIWVLDRWNCVVREVVVWPRPGDYRTRVYTVHGLTERFYSVVPPQPKCYGPGSLAGPRRFWDLGQGGLALFTDDRGLWQLNLGSGELGLVLSESGASGRFEADEVVAVALLRDAGAVGGQTALLLRTGQPAVLVVRAVEEACPADTTSRAGGDCVVRCESLGGYYVNASSGACMACGSPVCKAGEGLVRCTRGEPARCEACPVLADSDGARAWVVPGSCDPRLRRLRGPLCPVGHYAVDVAGAGVVCEPCPVSRSGIVTTTLGAGATRPEQCRCNALSKWLRRRGSDGACVSEAEQVYPVPAFGVGCPGGGGPPPNASLLDGHGYGRCLWRCNAGFYRRTGSGWLDKCGACETPGGPVTAASAWRTDGDDDAPLSCEALLQ